MTGLQDTVVEDQLVSSRSRKRLVGRRVLVSALIVVLPIVVFAGSWPLGGVSAAGDDLIYYLPVRQYIGDCIRAGEFPLWNPLVLMGSSIAADPQSGLWYPFTLLFVFLSPLVAYATTIVIHFILAGAGMYRFLRATRAEWRAALLGALAFEFCGYLVGHRGHLTIHHAVAWLPWMFYAWRRFADTGAYRHFALAAAAFGMQLLVQHMQPSVITCVLLCGYVGVVLWPLRRPLWWQFPLGMAMGAMLAGVQLVPTWFHFAGSGRGTAAYYLFIENSWVISSAVMMLFPMIYGADTQTSIWSHSWWGISHFGEQWAYGSIAILLLALASSALWRSRRSDVEGDSNTSPNPPFVRGGNWDREIIFWWVASGVALLIALGDLTPLSKVLFHLPVYRSFRVPARWILVWSVAMPVLACRVVSVLLRGGVDAERIARRMRWLVMRALPVVVVLCLAIMVLFRLQVDRLIALPYRYTHPNWNGLKAAIDPENPAIWWPLVLMLLTGWLLVQWSRIRCPRLFAALFVVCMLDLFSVAGFMYVSTGTYERDDLQHPPPLARAITELGPLPGDRLLVPRLNASYERSLEVLWPLSNMTWRLATFNGYGPFWSPANRLLFRFMAWGASEEMLATLRNPSLLRAMGVRWIVVRSPEERAVLRAAMTPGISHPAMTAIAGTEKLTAISWERGELWPIRIDAPGIYQLELDAEPTVGSPSRWFVRLETPEMVEIDRTRCLEPVDLSAGPRRFRFLFQCERAVGDAFARVKSEMGVALRAGRGTFGRVAELPGETVNGGPYVHRAELPGGISLYELPDTAELVWLAERVEYVPDLTAAVGRLLDWMKDAPVSRRAIVEGGGPVSGNGRGRISVRRPRGHLLDVEVDSESDGVLVFNESYDLGWRATVDDQPAAIRRVNAVCQGVAVPGGRHRVQFMYWPRGLGIGLGVTGGGVIALLLGFIFLFASRPGYAQRLRRGDAASGGMRDRFRWAAASIEWRVSISRSWVDIEEIRR